MTLSIHGLAVSRGVAIGRAVLIAKKHLDAPHYFIQPENTDREMARLIRARDLAALELERLLDSLDDSSNKDGPHEIKALLEAHLLLLRDEYLMRDVSLWIVERMYNAEWALTSQFEIILRQFSEMEDEYLRERATDLDQILEQILHAMQHDGEEKSQNSPENSERKANKKNPMDSALFLSDSLDTPLILVARDVSPADMLTFKQSVFAGFVTDVGGKTSHTAIIARSMDIPAVIGTRCSSELIKHDDWLIIDGDAGVIIVDPTEQMLQEYSIKKRQVQLDRERLQRLRHTPTVSLDGEKILLQANIEMPHDTEMALQFGAEGIGLVRSEFLFMGRKGNLPSENEQFEAYKATILGMKGMCVTIRTVDIGMDKPLDNNQSENSRLASALGLRAIRWSLADPEMFLTQLRAIFRASIFGPIKLLIPLLSQAKEIQQTFAYIEEAKASLRAKNIPFECIPIGAMIEVPAAALTCDYFLKYFDFLSIGTNDLIQYTLAIDRTDEAVAHLYDATHPAVLNMVAKTIFAAKRAGKDVSVCGEMAGDVQLTRFLLGLGLRNFSMHPTHILAVKQEILRSDITQLTEHALQSLQVDQPASYIAQHLGCLIV